MAIPTKNEDLHGNAPDEAEAALLLIDVINDLEFEGGEQLVEHALPMARHLAALKKRAKAANIPVIYVNDNFGKWRSDLRTLIDHCLNDGVRGNQMVDLLLPDDDDYFVLKPKHSAFFSTTLETLLDYLKVKTLIITGIAANICVLFTANDAYMRDFHLCVPSDCVVSNDVEVNRLALDQMKTVLKANITRSTDLDLVKMNSRQGQEG